MLGGTSESRVLAQALECEAGIDVVTSLAGRVEAPTLPAGTVRVGGFGGVEGLVSWIAAHETDVIVDATHPFAATMTTTASTAASAAGIRLVRLSRPEWVPGLGDTWLPASSVAEAARLVESNFDRAFLTIGRQEVAAFAAVTSTWFLVRSIDTPEGPLPSNHRLELARGPFDAEEETATMRRHRIDVVVSKNSGGAMTEAKLLAARQLGLPVVMIARPPAVSCDVSVESVSEVLCWLRSRDSGAR